MIASGPSRGQRLDPTTGLIQPWFTHAALDEIQEWSLEDQVVLEWGGGASTLWWGRRCRQVFTVELRAEWCAWIAAQAEAVGIGNLTVLHRPPTVSVQAYVRIPEGCAPDIVAIDGTQRLACLAKALTLPRPLTVICDNWQQDDSFISPEAEILMRPFLGVSYPDIHPAHEKHPWQTAIWQLT